MGLLGDLPVFLPEVDFLAGASPLGSSAEDLPGRDDIPDLPATGREAVRLEVLDMAWIAG